MRSARLAIFLLLACLAALRASAGEPVATPLSLDVRGKPVTALLEKPADARALLVLAHGGVMNLRHPFMEGVSAALAQHGIATLRFNFPYAEAKREQLDAAPLLIAALVSAVREAELRRGALPLLVGGKSVGGLMAARAAGEGKLSSAQGLVILGFPLHAPGRPSAVNARSLDGVTLPALFVQGTHDPLADLGLMRAVVEKLEPRAELRVVQNVDHGFEAPGDTGPPKAEVYEEIAGAVAAFVARLAREGG
jgi:hypothetical protein